MKGTKKEIMKKYNYLLNEETGEIFPASEFFFYPLKVKDYIDVYRKSSSRIYPAMVFVYLTHRCNDRCKGCFVSNIEDGNADISLNVLEQLLYDLSSGGTKAVKLAGREPTVHPNLSECLDLCKELGMKTLLITSGTNIDNHAESISKSCTHLRVSLNTISEELHNKLHFPRKEALRFNDRIKWVKKIVKERNRRDLVSGATFLVRPETISYSLEYAKMCKNIGFDYVRYTVLDDEKGEYPKEWQEVYHKLLGIEDEGFKIWVHNSLPFSNINLDQDYNINGKLVDPAIYSRVTIHANGKVAACQEGWRGNWPEKNMAIYGNINELPFKEIWFGNKREKFLKYIQNNMNGIFDRPKCCNNCKYESFNAIHSWIIQQIYKYPNSSIKEIIVEKTWKT